MSSIVIAAVLFLISPSSSPTETCTKEFRRSPSIIGISGEIAEGTVLERQVGRCGGLPRRRHASEVNGEERSRRRRRIRRFCEGERERTVMVVHLYSRTNIRSDHAHTYTCVHEYVCTCAFLPRLFFNAFMPTAKELSGISRRKSGTLCLRRLTFSLSFALLFYHPALTYDSPGCSLSPGRLA